MWEPAVNLLGYCPIGADTDLHIHADPTWNKVAVTAYAYDGTALGEIEANIADNSISFSYAGTVDGKSVGYYQITPST